MRITLLDLTYNVLSCLNIHVYSSSFLFSQNTNHRYLTVFTYVNGSVPIETVRQYNLKRQIQCTQILQGWITNRLQCYTQNTYRAAFVEQYPANNETKLCLRCMPVICRQRISVKNMPQNC